MIPRGLLCAFSLALLAAGLAVGHFVLQPLPMPAGGATVLGWLCYGAAPSA